MLEKESDSKNPRTKSTLLRLERDCERPQHAPEKEHLAWKRRAASARTESIGLTIGGRKETGLSNSSNGRAIWTIYSHGRSHHLPFTANSQTLALQQQVLRRSYRDARYPTWLETKSSFMDEDKEGPKKGSKILCQNLHEANQSPLEPCRIKFSTTYANFTILCQINVTQNGAHRGT
jgi:hypothetical protein